MNHDGPLGPWHLLQSYPVPTLEEIWERRFLGKKMNFTRIKNMKPGEVYLYFEKENEVPLFWGPIPSLDWNYDEKLGELRHKHKLHDWKTQMVVVHSDPFMAETSQPYASLGLVGRHVVEEMGEERALREGVFVWNAQFVTHPLHQKEKKD